MVVVIIVMLGVVPVIDAEIVFARDRDMVMRDGVEETNAAIVVRRAVGDQCGVDTVLLEIEREMQTGDSRADDSNVPSHVRVPLFGYPGAVLPMLQAA